MRLALLGGVSLAILATSPALAQPANVSNQQILDRLNALEAKVNALEARNADLQGQLAAARTAVATQVASSTAHPVTRAESAPAPVPAAASGGRGTAQPAPAGTPAVQWTIVPQFNSPDGNFTFKPRGMLEVDYANFHDREGGYKFNDGTQIRRGRFGFDGTAFKQFAWRIEAEFVGGQVNLLDAYVAYTRIPRFTVTLGQLKVPAGLEANSSDAFNEFLERGEANNAFGAVGGERRVGATFAYAGPVFTATGGIYGANESIGRNAITPGETYSVNGRVTVEPINAPGRLIHVGASAYHVMDIAGNSVTIGDRPDVRVDNGFLETVTVPGTNVNGVQTGVKSATYYDLEGAGVLGPFSVQGEYNHMHLDRYRGASAINYDGFYVFGTAFLTGESRTFKGGVIDRVKPLRPFDPAKGNWGAFELAARYDRIDLTDYGFSPLRRVGHSWTGALNWYLNGNLKLMLNYIRFTGTNSPLVAQPATGTVLGTAKGDAFATRLHLDF